MITTHMKTQPDRPKHPYSDPLTAGIITEVWAGGPAHRRQVYAHVKYSDGDKEDIGKCFVHACMICLLSVRFSAPFRR